MQEQEIVAYCGLVCTECPTYKATRENDDKARAKIAKEWSQQFQYTCRAEDINCHGCLAVGKVQVAYCSACDIRRCGIDRKVLNCAYCVEYPCDKLSNFHSEAADARARLEAIRSKN